ncbi:MAG: exodeoxyribonuclease VII large subunit, partial [Nitrospirota bacterium]|nr:exodeoxyribonuclease VII large subunit [Nitrospirota bacterium]
RGEYQIIADYLEPKGVGALQLAFLQLKEKLEKEGYFDEERKRPLPLLPRRIGIVTSPTGAAIRDMLTVLSRRYANMEVLLYPVRVQGDGAAAEIARAIEELNEYGGIDVIIAGRGGGSIEDLWAFNEEVVARAIARSAIPVISAVGHETDFTISDFVADLRAPTPSAAAEMVVKSKDELNQKIANFESRLLAAVEDSVQMLRHRLIVARKALVDPEKQLNFYLQRLDELSLRLGASWTRRVRRERDRLASHQRLIFSKTPAELIGVCRLRGVDLEKRLKSIMSHRLEITRGKMARLAAMLDGLSPLAVLGRGYSIARLLPAGTILRDAAGVKEGSTVAVTLTKGELRCIVKETRISNEAD